MLVKIFFCYAREDEILLSQLKRYLKPLQREGLIEMWHDRDISAGTEWEQEISKHLNEAQIILLLISPDFIDSDYCYSIEMKQALGRHQRGEAHVIPVILRPVYWQGVLGKLQALPTDAIPVTDPSWYSLDQAFFNIAEAIRRLTEEITNAPLAVHQKVPEAILVKEVQIYIERGEQALAQGLGREAAIAYARAAQIEPDNPNIHLGLAEANLALGNYTVVSMACRRVHELQREDGSESMIAQALVDLLDHRYKEALRYIDIVINNSSNIAYAYALRSYLLYALGMSYNAELADVRAARLTKGGHFDNCFPPLNK